MHSKQPAETFLKGMHTLARGCPALRWLPRVRAPKTRFIPEGNAYGGPDFDMARKNTPPALGPIAKRKPVSIVLTGTVQSLAGRNCVGACGGVLGTRPQGAE
jgi:hypothetical protein